LLYSYATLTASLYGRAGPVGTLNHNISTARGTEAASDGGGAASAESRRSEERAAEAADASRWRVDDEQDLGEFFFHARVDDVDAALDDEGQGWQRRLVRSLGNRRSVYRGGGSGAPPGLPV